MGLRRWQAPSPPPQPAVPTRIPGPPSGRIPSPHPTKRSPRWQLQLVTLELPFWGCNWPACSFDHIMIRTSECWFSEQRFWQRTTRTTDRWCHSQHWLAKRVFMINTLNEDDPIDLTGPSGSSASCAAAMRETPVARDTLTSIRVKDPQRLGRRQQMQRSDERREAPGPLLSPGGKQF